MKNELLAKYYQMVLDYYERHKDSYHTLGLCRCVWSIDLSLKECSFLIRNLREHKPNNTQFPEFYNHNEFRGDAYWWGTYSEGKKQRVLFLEMLIKRYSDETTE